jgi:hypothetical protein
MGEDAASDRFSAGDRLAGSVSLAARIQAEDDLRVEHGDKRREVPVAGGSDEGIDQGALLDRVGLGCGRRPADAAPGAARQLAGGSRGPSAVPRAR